MIAVPLADDTITALIVPGLWEALWRSQINAFENDPRLCASITGATAGQTGVLRRRWLAAKTGTASPRERYAAGEPITFRRWQLGRGRDFADDWIASHPLATDRPIRWLTVDPSDKVTASEVGP